MRMKRIVLIGLFLLFIVLSSYAQDDGAAFAFGMPFSVQYNHSTNDISFWNLRYCLGFDFFLRLDQSILLGLELDAQFGFRKNDFMDKDIQNFYMGFPLRLVVMWTLPVLILEGYTGVIYQGDAALVNGVLRPEYFEFEFQYEIGARIGLGDMSFFFIDVGYVIASVSYFHAGIGVRIGLF